MTHRRRRVTFVFLIYLIVFIFNLVAYKSNPPTQPAQGISTQLSYNTAFATTELGLLQVKGRAPKTGYQRSLFGTGWADVGGCDVRNIILQRDLADEIIGPIDRCKVLSGKLDDPYTNKVIEFQRGEQTSGDIQIDHVVALSDAWQKGAQGMSEQIRIQFANDPLNLLAVDGQINQEKSDSDAASWLPPNKSYRCRYVARQTAVKRKYNLWVTMAEKDAIKRVLTTCPDQRLPQETIKQ